MKKRAILMAMLCLAAAPVYPAAAEAVPAENTPPVSEPPGPCEYFPGDLDCDGFLTRADADILLRLIAGLQVPDEIQFDTADMNRDDRLSAADLTLLKRAIMAKTEARYFRYPSPDGSLVLYAAGEADYFGAASYRLTWEDPEGDAIAEAGGINAKTDPFTENGSWQGETDFGEDGHFLLKWGKKALSVCGADGKELGKYAYPDTTARMQTVSQELEYYELPELTAADITAECRYPMTKKVSVGRCTSVLYNETWGLIGPVLMLNAKDSVQMPCEVTLHYDTEALRWIPEKNLLVLAGEPRGAGLSPAKVQHIDTENQTVTFTAEGPCNFALVDAYSYYQHNRGKFPGSGRVEDSEFAYDRFADFTAYPSDWERAGNTGSIMQLVDKEWVLSCGTEFHVSTPQELAGFVYYCNARLAPTINDVYLERPVVTLYLEADIDLSGYHWAPLEQFAGTVEGNGHTVSNLHIENHVNAGFIGEAATCAISNITFADAEIIGKQNAGVVCGLVSAGADFTGVHVTGKVSAPGNAGAIYGKIGLHGMERLISCTAEVSFTGVQQVLAWDETGRLTVG